MTCCQYQSRLSRYLDGELSPWSRWKVETHLRYCPACAATLRELSAVDEGMLLLARETPPPDYLTDAVMFRLPAMPPGRRLRRGMIPWAAGLAVAGVQAVVLCGAYWWGFLHGSDRGAPAASSGAAASSPFFVQPDASPVSVYAPGGYMPAGNLPGRSTGRFLGRPMPFAGEGTELVDLERRPQFPPRPAGVVVHPVLEGSR